ncbi:MAG: sphingomyelin phosphodiesterase [Chitinophagales bacterium]
MLVKSKNFALFCFGILFFFFSIKIVAQNKTATDSIVIEKQKNEQNVELQILTWNIQLLPATFWPLSWRFRSKQYVRIPWITSHLNEQNYDVVVLQEVFTKRMTRKIRKQLKAEYPYQVRPKNKKMSLRFSDGVLIVSKIPIKEIDYVFFEDSYSHDKMANKGCVIIEGEKQDFRFQLLGTHLQSINKEEAHKVRESQCRQMKTALLDKHFEADVPQFVTGDLNVRKSIPLWYNSILEILDAKDTPLNDEKPYTFDNENYWVKTFHKHDSVQLDYVLLRANDTKTSIDNLSIQRLKKEHKGKTIDYADHYGVLAKVLLKR